MSDLAFRTSNLVPSGDLRTEIGKMLVVARRVRLAQAPDQLDVEDTAIWFAFLDGYVAPDDVVPALIRHGRLSKWWPTPHELIEQADALVADRRRDAAQRRREEVAAERRREEEAERSRWNALTPEAQAAEVAQRDALIDEIRSKMSFIY